jgi:CubicO group peptidase (beta-lactamase class C family)
VRPADLTLDTWQDGPGNRWAFQHVDELVATTTISRGAGPTLELSSGPTPSVPGLDDFLGRTATDAFVVLRGRTIVVERYLNGMTPATRHLLQSVSKSLCGTVFGRYVGSGQVDVTAPVAQYLPELAGSGFGDATVRQVLDMMAAVSYDETYDSADSDVAQHERVGGWRTPLEGDPVDTYAFLPTLGRAGEHGRAFTYCSANTEVLAWILERVTGRGYAELLASDLWSQIGAEHDALVTVDQSGFPMASGGVCVTARDLARFGRVLLDGGTTTWGGVVVPARWLADIQRGGDRGAAADSMSEAHPHGSYRNQFWVTGDDHGSFYGVGIYGQYVWMDPTADVVIVKLSSLPDADDPGRWVEHVRFFETLARSHA